MTIKQAQSLNLFCSIKFDSWVNGFIAEIQLTICFRIEFVVDYQTKFGEAHWKIELETPYFVLFLFFISFFSNPRGNSYI
jgi:hypothetical protein